MTIGRELGQPAGQWKRQEIEIVLLRFFDVKLQST